MYYGVMDENKFEHTSSGELASFFPSVTVEHPTREKHRTGQWYWSGM